MRDEAKLSIVIPTWNEAPLIADAVASAYRLADEVIVADAGSPDGTAVVADSAGAKVVGAVKGRGPQLDVGARAAGGDVLLFLHADARLPPRARNAVLESLSDPRVVGGNFLIRFLPESWFTRYLVPANDLRRMVTRRFYGDSAIFVRRSVYEKLGGFRPWPLFEDYEFSTRLRKAGRCAYIRHVSVYASARRFEGREIRTLFTWMGLQSLYTLGFCPDRLARHYPDVRGEHPSRFLGEWGKISGLVESADARL